MIVNCTSISCPRPEAGPPCPSSVQRSLSLQSGLVFRNPQAALSMPAYSTHGLVSDWLPRTQTQSQLHLPWYFCRVWPYESVVPGAPQPPAGAQEYLARQVLKDEKRTKRYAGCAAAPGSTCIHDQLATASQQIIWLCLPLLVGLITLEWQACLASML